MNISAEERQENLETTIQSRFSGEVKVLPPQAWHPYGLSLGVAGENLSKIMQVLRDDPGLRFEMLVDVTAVDWLDRREPRFDVVYQLQSLEKKTRLTVKVEVEEDEPLVPSVVNLWSSAEFLEREVWDMFGIRFEGHPDLRRILMYDEFVGHPLRKDYPLKGKQPRVMMRIPELRNSSADMKRDDLVSLPTKRASVFSDTVDYKKVDEKNRPGN